MSKHAYFYKSAQLHGKMVCVLIIFIIYRQHTQKNQGAVEKKRKKEQEAKKNKKGASIDKCYGAGSKG